MLTLQNPSFAGDFGISKCTYTADLCNTVVTISQPLENSFRDGTCFLSPLIKSKSSLILCMVLANRD